MSKRPSINDPEVLAAGVESMWPRIVEWMGGDAPTEQREIESVKGTLRAAFRSDEDAYEIARNLEHDGWTPDADLVETLGDCAQDIDRAHMEAERAWVAAGGVAMVLPVGTRVKHRLLGSEVGTIVAPYGSYDPRDRGFYLVFCATRGDLRDGPEAEAVLRKGGRVTHGTYLRAEEIEVVP